MPVVVPAGRAARLDADAAAAAVTPSLADLLATATARAGAGDVAGARDAYRAALEQAPARADLWHNLGVLAAAARDRDEALAAFAAAARCRPDWAAPWHARGHVLFATGDADGARAAFADAVARDAAHVPARVNLALSFQRLGRWSDSLPHLQHARAAAPADEDVWWLTRGTLLRLRRDEEALADYVRFAPHASPTRTRVVVAALASARALAHPAQEAAALAAACDHAYAAGESALLAEVLALVQYDDIAPGVLARLYAAYDALMQTELAAAGDASRLAPAQPRSPGGARRIRIGYVSADFRRHVMGATMAGVIAAHDRAEFEVRLYSLAPPPNEDAVTDALRAAADGFTRLADLDDAQAARAIAADDLDLVVDLMAHSAFARPGIVARKPARVVVTHLGQHGCLGLSAVDYKMTDAIADTPANAAYQVEALLPLSVCLMPLRPYRAPPPRWTRAALDIPDDAVVLEAFVAVQKLSPRCLALWRAILAAAPRAVLLASPPRDDDRAALARRFAAFGLPAERLRFVPYLAQSLEARHALADAALDTLPYSGGDTTVAALAAGVPVVARIGTRHAERVSASILRHAGLPQLVAGSDDAYVALAVRVATDAAFRDAQRAAVRAALGTASLTHPAIYTRALETAYLRALTEKRMLPR